MLLAICDALYAAPRFRGQRRLAKWLHKWAGAGVAHSQYGPLIKNKPGDLTNFYYISGFDQRNYGDVYDEVRELRAGSCFIDIGSNAGLFSLIASPVVGEDGIIISFEPSISIFEDLVSNIAVNGAANIFPVNAALGSNTRRAKFSNGTETHSGIGHLDKDGDTTIFQVNFDQFIPLFDPVIGDREVVIKVDVEGAELEVLTSMTSFLSRSAVKKVIVEIDAEYMARFDSTPIQLYRHMQTLGFCPKRGSETNDHFNEIFKREIS